MDDTIRGWAVRALPTPDRLALDDVRCAPASRTRRTGTMDHFTRFGLAFPVHDSGPADGEPVFLLHGFPQTPASYDRVVDVLDRQGLRTLVPTQRGYAAPARPPHRRDYRIAELVADVVRLISAAGAERG